MQAQVPIIPVAISGSRDLMPKHKLRIKGGAVKLSFFPPIDTAELTVKDRDRLMEDVHASIASAVDIAREEA